MFWVSCTVQCVARHTFPIRSFVGGLPASSRARKLMRSRLVTSQAESMRSRVRRFCPSGNSDELTYAQGAHESQYDEHSDSLSYTCICMWVKSTHLHHRLKRGYIRRNWYPKSTPKERDAVRPTVSSAAVMEALIYSCLLKALTHPSPSLPFPGPEDAITRRPQPRTKIGPNSPRKRRCPRNLNLHPGAHGGRWIQPPAPGPRTGSKPNAPRTKAS